MRHTAPRRFAMLSIAVGVVLIGCASVDTAQPSAWRVEPLIRLTNGGNAANGRAYFALGQAQQGEGRWQEASEAFSKAVFNDPDNAEAFQALGIAHAVLYRYDGAIAAFSRAVDLAPERAPYLNNLGYAFILSGQSARALPYLRAALARDPAHEQARANIARAELMLIPVVEVGRTEAVVPVANATETLKEQSRAIAAAKPDETTPSPPTAAVFIAGPDLADRSAAASDAGVVAGRLSGFKLEITNGNGMQGAAARLRDWLRERGIEGGRLTNLKPYATTSTIVQYQPGYMAQAQAIARRMPELVGVAPASRADARADVRVLIGHDVITAKSCPGQWPCSAAPVAQLMEEVAEAVLN